MKQTLIYDKASQVVGTINLVNDVISINHLDVKGNKVKFIIRTESDYLFTCPNCGRGHNEKRYNGFCCTACDMGY